MNGDRVPRRQVRGGIDALVHDGVTILAVGPAGLRRSPPAPPDLGDPSLHLFQVPTQGVGARSRCRRRASAIVALERGHVRPMLLDRVPPVPGAVVAEAAHSLHAASITACTETKGPLPPVLTMALWMAWLR